MLMKMGSDMESSKQCYSFFSQFGYIVILCLQCDTSTSIKNQLAYNQSILQYMIWLDLKCSPITKRCCHCKHNITIYPNCEKKTITLLGAFHVATHLHQHVCMFVLVTKWQQRFVIGEHFRSNQIIYCRILWLYANWFLIDVEVSLGC
jgi:hypothetical protein